MSRVGRRVSRAEFPVSAPMRAIRAGAFHPRPSPLSMNLLFGVPALAGPGRLTAGHHTDGTPQTGSWSQCTSSRSWGLSMNRRFLLVLLLVIDWVVVFQYEHEDQRVHGPNPCGRTQEGFP